jgi:hypothetical protein
VATKNAHETANEPATMPGIHPLYFAPPLCLCSGI